MEATMTHGWVIFAMLFAAASGGCACQTTAAPKANSAWKPGQKTADKSAFANAPHAPAPLLGLEKISDLDEIELIGLIDLLPDGRVVVCSNGLPIRESCDEKPAESSMLILSQFQSARFEMKTDPALHVFHPHYGGIVDFEYLGVKGERVILGRKPKDGTRELISVPCYNKLPIEIHK
jgi:hypothetical protein